MGHAALPLGSACLQRHSIRKSVRLVLTSINSNNRGASAKQGWASPEQQIALESEILFVVPRESCGTMNNLHGFRQNLIALGGMSVAPLLWRRSHH